MILIKPDEGAAVITFPRIEEEVKKILLRWYSEDKAKQYAENVQVFFKENAKFPEDAVYKLENEVFYIFDIQNFVWENTKNTKKSYVISDKNSKFWEEFEKEFPYLMTYKADIQQIIYDATAAMFKVEMQKTHFVNRDINGVFTIGTKDDFAVREAICNYVNPQEQEAYIVRILEEVFHSNEMPIFLMDKGITVAAITSNSISTSTVDKGLLDFLKKSFSAHDSYLLKARIMNAIKHAINNVEEVMINEDGEYVLNIGGLHVFPFKDKDKECKIVWDKNNIQLLSKIVEEQYIIGSGFKDGRNSCTGWSINDARLSNRAMYLVENPEFKDKYSVTFNGNKCSLELVFEVETYPDWGKVVRIRWNHETNASCRVYKNKVTIERFGKKSKWNNDLGFLKIQRKK